MARQFPFDPAAILRELKATQSRAEVLAALLRSYGLEVQGEAIEPTPSPEASAIHGTPRPRSGKRRRRGRAPSSHPPQKPKLADLAVDVLKKHNGRAHGKQIVEDLLKAGHMRNVANPGSSIVTAMTRDKRIERDTSAPNTWRLVA